MEEFEGDNEPQQKISRYNSGIAQIYRLDILWRDSHKHSRLGELTKWNWDLDRVWLELAGDLEEDDKQITDYEAFTTLIGDLNKKFTNRKIDLGEYKLTLYKLLMEKELFLRRLQNKLGKGSSYLEGDEDYMDG